MAFSLLCGSISDTLHHRVALIGNSFRPGNILIVSHTSAIHTGPRAGSAFTVAIALEGNICIESVKTEAAYPFNTLNKRVQNKVYWIHAEILSFF